VISAHFGASLDSELGSRPLNPGAEKSVSDAKAQPLGIPKTGALAAAEAARVRGASVSASTSAFHLGVGLAGLLMILGGVASGFGIADPPRRRARSHLSSDEDENRELSSA
jgi:hypothetical protein